MALRSPAGPRSTLAQLPDAVREEVSRRIHDGRTAAEVAAYLNERGHRISRSAVSRFRRNAMAALRRYREAEAVAAGWAREVGQEPRGAVGRLVIETLRVAAFVVAMRTDGSGSDGPEAREIGILARALRDLEAAGKIALEREALRAAIDRKLAAAEAALAPGADGPAPDAADAIRRIREEVYGLFETDDGRPPSAGAP